MSVATSNAPATAASAPESTARRLLRQTEIDPRMIGMIFALMLIWVGFDIYGGIVNGFAAFLTPRNLFNIFVQTASVAVMTTGMVLVIVTRQIDLSVGSILGFTGMVVGVTQVYWLPHIFGVDSPMIWIAAVVLAIAFGALIGGFQGWIIAYLGVPSFIVTLGGQLVWRGAAWWVARGETIAPLDDRFSLIGGGSAGSIGFWASWGLCVVGIVAFAAAIIAGRGRRQRFGFPLRPVWAEVFVGCLGAAALIWLTWIFNAYFWPPMIAKHYAETHHIAVPPGGLKIPYGYAIPVLMAFATGLAMTFLAKRTRFGRYVYAIGGNPEAAALAGVNTKRIVMLVFALMGALAGISACIDSARLDSATNALGQFDELYVIAAAVIGGTSLAGGVGSIYGAMLGALVMQSLQSGMVLIGVDSAVQQMVVGLVLVVAVYLDTIYRQKVK